MLNNTTDYDGVSAGVNDLTGDPQFGTGYFLTSSSPAVDAASADSTVAQGGGDRADIGYHELTAAPLSIFMGKLNDSAATANSGVAAVEYAIVQVTDNSLSAEETAPTSGWLTTTLDSPNEALSYWSADFSTNSGGEYRIYSRATDVVGNTETDADAQYDGPHGA